MEEHQNLNVSLSSMPKEYAMNIVKTGIAAVLMAVTGNIVLADQVIVDDLVVDGSACIGIDCVNGESFGFDTIRLKENNLRIKFQDTSASASFPSNDWQITANDSANGGANKFSIDDVDGGKTPFTIEAGAPSHSLYVEDSGQVGFGTSTPVVDLHSVSGNTPTLRLQQDGSAGWTPQTWDVAGNETNFFIRDVTNGSKLPFRIRPGAPTSSIDIASDGDVGIGTSSPKEALHIHGDESEVKLKITNNAGGDYAFSVSNDEFRISLQGSGGSEFTVQSDGTVKIGPGSSTVFRLEPDGNLVISGNITESGTPDYVFEEDYSLMPLDELAAFVKRQKHLPNIPSAEEVSKKGLSVTMLQFKLLEKVEELTLYTLAQEKTIEDLRARLAALENVATGSLTDKVALASE